jgi:tagatose-1,6-bisphosphate aldolase non-catalytic subunit AgaZ/GatZ
MEQYKLGVGPMSLDVVDAITSYKNKDKIMVVASRNQVDYKDFYVCDSKTLSSKIKPANILLCRDHCGPYFKDSDIGLSLEDAIEECKKTIRHDLESGFDLIHIDTSKVNDSEFEIAKILFDYALNINPDVLFEFGSEENTGCNIEESISRIIPQINFFKKYSGARYFVSQTGSLTKNKQVGTFNVSENTIVARTIHDNGLYFKEHNADYLRKESIAKRTLAGVDAMNIAPQLGYLQSWLIELDCRVLDPEGLDAFNEFNELVYRNNKWKRWVTPDISDKTSALHYGGHYHFDSKEYKDLISFLEPGRLSSFLEMHCHHVFDDYLGITNINS